jgi:putative transcriptional regulator
MLSKKSPLKGKGLAEFEVQRDLALELLESVQEMKAGKASVVLAPAAEARVKTGLSQ